LESEEEEEVQYIYPTYSEKSNQQIENMIMMNEALEDMIQHLNHS
jgi:hypothetical protein